MTNSMLHPTRLRNTTTLKHWKICCALGAAGFVFSAGPVSAQTHSNNLHSLTLAQPPNSQQTNSATPQNPADKLRDGQHDFDFEIGRWNIHLKRLKDRLAG